MTQLTSEEKDNFYARIGTADKQLVHLCKWKVFQPTEHLRIQSL